MGQGADRTSGYRKIPQVPNSSLVGLSLVVSAGSSVILIASVFYLEKRKEADQKTDSENRS